MNDFSTAGPVVDTTDATFESDVFQRSRDGLVVVDFWAAWCAPCRMLAPLLEKLAHEFSGRFTLVKANTDETPEAAGRLGVSGIPAVFAVLDGDVIDLFQGLLPEGALRTWLERNFRRGELLETRREMRSNPAEAEATLRRLWEESPNDSEPPILLAELLLEADRDEECHAVLERLEQRGFLEPEAEKIKAALDLKGKAGVDLGAARAAAEAAPDDLRLQLALAEALVGQQQYQQAFDICLSLVEKDRHQTGEKARELMVEVFRILPDDSELTSSYRRKLSMLLY